VRCHVHDAASFALRLGAELKAELSRGGELPPAYVRGQRPTHTRVTKKKKIERSNHAGGNRRRQTEGDAPLSLDKEVHESQRECTALVQLPTYGGSIEKSGIG
jgi:hypothetical protein